MAGTNSKIYKVAAFSLLGFCAVSIGMDRTNAGPVVSQIASFCGAFLGACVARGRKHRTAQRTGNTEVTENRDTDAS